MGDAAEQGAVWIAGPARPYRCQRSRSMTTATRTITRTALDRGPIRRVMGVMRASPQPEEGQDGQNDDDQPDDVDDVVHERSQGWRGPPARPTATLIIAQLAAEPARLAGSSGAIPSSKKSAPEGAG